MILREIVEEELVVDQKSCPGLNTFDGSNCLRYFSKETILEKYLKTTNVKQFMDHLMFSAVHHLEGDHHALFYLMSVYPNEDVVELCRDNWQCDKKLTISVDDVIRVFFNWGASPESLGIDSDPQLFSSFVPSLPAVSMVGFPTPYNVKAVLYAVLNSQLIEEGNDCDKKRYNFIKIMVRASLDHRLCRHRTEFHQVICKILDSFQDWNVEKVSAMIEEQSLQQLGLQNAVYVCCSLFTVSPRVKDFKIFAVRHLLHSKFGLLPPFQPLNSFLGSLPDTRNIVERFKLIEIYVLIQLLNTLVTTCNPLLKEFAAHKNNISELNSYLALIEGVRSWAEEVHSQLMGSKFLFTVEGGYVRERCTRMRADCVELVCVLKNEAARWQRED